MKTASVVASVVAHALLQLFSISPAAGQISFSAVRAAQVDTASVFAQHVDIADLNGDGEADLLFSGSMIAIALSEGDGEYGAVQVLSSPLSDFVGIAQFADLNSDGILDILAKAGGAGLSARLGLGSGSFDDPVVTLPYVNPIDWIPTQVTLEDLSGDGVLDLLVAARQAFFFPWPTVQMRFTVALGLGDGTFAPGTTLDLAPVTMNRSTRAFDLVDVDGDADLDIIRLISGPLDNLSILFNDGAGLFQDQRSTIGAKILRAFDADADGLVDLVFEDGTAGFFARGWGDGTFETAVLSYAAGSLAYDSLLDADFDADGLPDLVRNVGGDVQVLRGVGEGLYELALEMPGWLPLLYSWDVPPVVFDVNNDQRVDLLAMRFDIFSSIETVFEVAFNLTYPAESPFDDLGGDLVSTDDRMLQVARGSLQPGAMFSVEASGTPLGGEAWLVLGLDRHDLSLHGGTVGPSLDIVVGPVLGDSSLDLAWAGYWPSNVPPGMKVYSQVWSHASDGQWSATTTVSATSP